MSSYHHYLCEHSVRIEMNDDLLFEDSGTIEDCRYIFGFGNRSGDFLLIESALLS